MLKYILRRLLLALPTLLVISFIAFGLSKCAPGDPVVNVFGEENYKTLDPQQQAASYGSHAKELGLIGPSFYFEFTTAAYPDTLWRVFPLDRRERLEKLIGQSGNWPAVQRFDQAISQTIRATEALPATFPQSGALLHELPLLIRADRISLLDSALNRITNQANVSFLSLQNAGILDSVPTATNLKHAVEELGSSVEALSTQQSPEKLHIPALHWYGLKNQYHQWLMGFLTGQLGLSRRKVAIGSELESGLLATLTINGFAILLAYLIAIPLGVGMARKKDRLADRWTKRLLFFLYGMPMFWLSGLLILFVTGTAFFREALPSIYFDIQDAWQPGKSSFGSWWIANASKCILPILILALHAIAVLALQMRSGMLGTLREDFIRTARAKGVPEEDVYWNHALRNALFPLITIFASVLPAIFTGSLVVEAIFNFPGIGTKTFQAYLGQDMPLLSVILMVSAALTIIGSLLADLLYAWADPRVRFTKENG